MTQPGGLARQPEDTLSAEYKRIALRRHTSHASRGCRAPWRQIFTIPSGVGYIASVPSRPDSRLSARFRSAESAYAVRQDHSDDGAGSSLGQPNRGALDEN